MTSLAEIQVVSSTWLKLEEFELPAHGKTGMIDILISGALENNDCAETINTIMSETTREMQTHQRCLSSSR